jgi:hypothetical protein
LSERYAGWIETADERFRRCILPQGFCVVIVGGGCSENHALNNCRSLQPNIAIVIVAADSRSNRGSDGVLAFQQKAKEASGCSSMLEWLLATTKGAISHDAQNRFHDFPNTLSPMPLRFLPQNLGR